MQETPSLVRAAAGFSLQIPCGNGTGGGGAMMLRLADDNGPVTHGEPPYGGCFRWSYYTVSTRYYQYLNI